MWIILFCLVFLGSARCNSIQNENGDSDCIKYFDTRIESQVYTFTDSFPGFLNGDKDVLGFFLENFQYPKNPLIHPLTFFIEFIIDSDGMVVHSSIKINDKGVEDYLTEVETEVRKTVKSMPAWKAATCNGVNVPFLFKLPVRL